MKNTLFGKFKSDNRLTIIELATAFGVSNNKIFRWSRDGSMICKINNRYEIYRPATKTQQHLATQVKELPIQTPKKY